MKYSKATLEEVVRLHLARPRCIGSRSPDGAGRYSVSMDANCEPVPYGCLYLRDVLSETTSDDHERGIPS